MVITDLLPGAPLIVLVGDLGSTSRLHISLKTVGINLCTNAMI